MKTLSREELAPQAAVFKALGHPARLRIVHELALGPRLVGELVEQVGLSWASVSRHLAVLKTCGVVSDQRRGLRVYYKVALPSAVDFAQTLARKNR